MLQRNLQDLLYHAIEGAARAVVAYLDEAPARTPFREAIAANTAAYVSEDVPFPTDADAPPEREEEDQVFPHEDSVIEEPDTVVVVVDGVPKDHPIHAEVAELLPSFRMINAMVESQDFRVTPESVEKAMPVWVAFNALSRYRDDENFPAILAYVRTYIKPVCFAAMGKEVTK